MSVGELAVHLTGYSTQENGSYTSLGSTGEQILLAEAMRDLALKLGDTLPICQAVACARKRCPLHNPLPSAADEKADLGAWEELVLYLPSFSTLESGSCTSVLHLGGTVELALVVELGRRQPVRV